MRTIAKLAFKETLYKRIFLITVLMTLAFLIFYGIITHYGDKQTSSAGFTGQDALERMVMSTQLVSIGLYFASFITALLAILASVGSVAAEIESHQIDTLLARPLKRRDIILGKYMGLGGLLCVYAICLFAGILLMNHWFGGQLRVDLVWGQMLKGAALFALEPLVLIALSLWLSTRTTTINGGIVMIILYGISFIGGFIEQLGSVIHNTALVNIGILSSLLFPIDSLFRKVILLLFDTSDNPLSFASQGLFGSVSAPSNVMLIYAGLYALFFLFFASRTFAKRDL